MTERPWVLIAEDSSTVRLKLEQMVEALGFEPILAADGAAAIQSFDEVHPSIVLLDINMPEVDICGLSHVTQLAASARHAVRARAHPPAPGLPAVVC